MIEAFRSIYSWQEVQEYLKHNYIISDMRDNALFFKFRFGGSDQKRSQVVCISKDDSVGNAPWVQILSRVGKILQSRLDSVLEWVGERICGLVKVGEQYFVRHSIPLKNLELEQLDDMIGIVVALADEAELNFVGGDAS